MHAYAAAGGAADLRSRVRDQTNDFILSRTRVGLGILLLANVLFAAMDFVFSPASVSFLIPLRLVLAVCVIGLLVVSRGPRARAWAVTLARLAVALAAIQALGVGIMRGQVATAAVLTIGLGAAVSTVFPWGVRAQLGAVATTGIATVAALWADAGTLDVAALTYPAAAAGLAFGASLYTAHVLKRYFTGSIERELALQASHEQIRNQLSQLDALYQSAPVGLALIDAHLRYLRVNQALADMNGVAVEDHIGRTVRDVVPKSAADVVEPLCREVVATGRPLVDFEIRGQTARQPGVTGEWCIHVWPLRNPDGAVWAVSCTVQEVTEWKRMQEALRRNEERLRLVSEAASDAMWDWDLSTGAVWWNENIRTFFGYTAADVGPTIDWWYDNIHPEERPRIEAQVRALLDSRERHFSVEYRYRRADGSYAYVFDRGSVVRDAAGKPVRLVGALADISKRKHAEQALARMNDELERRVAERTAQLSALIEHSSDAIWSVDREHRVTGFNSLVRQLSEEAHGEPLQVGQPFTVPEEEREYWWPLYERTLAGERSLFERQYRVGGEQRSYLISMTPIVTEGEVRGATVYAKDITDLRRAEERARQHQAELTHVLRVGTVGEMAAGLAHEINQPLGAIANYAQGCRLRIASGTARADELLPAVTEIAAQALRAGEIIRRLRQLVQKGKTPHEKADLNAIVAEATSVIEPQVRCQGVALRIDLAPGLPPVEVDQIQIEQVILNLMLNGLEAMQAVNGTRPELVVSTNAAGDGSVEVVVRDTGVGLTPAVSETMFEPFFTSKPSGLGMGLAISRSIVEEHGGRLWATSNPDHGASFHVALPVVPPDGLARSGEPQ
jgi:two-component system sensor kinase FixL